MARYLTPIPDMARKVLVYRDGTRVYAIARDGTEVYNQTESNANRRAAIQAAIDHCAGTYTIGHGGGGVVTISDQLYNTDTTAIEVDAPGISIECPWGVFDRNGFVATAHAFYGATIVPSGNISNLDVQEGAGSQPEQPVICIGKLATGSTYPTSSTTQNENNPHGTRIVGINVDLRNGTTSDGIMLCDTQYVTIQGCNVANASASGGRGIVILSTLAPDNGAHGNRIVETFVANCYTGIVGSGSGSTDSMITGCRVLQSTDYSIQLGAGGGGGGWQISDCHLTTGNVSCRHIDAGAPAQIINNYLDTTGDYHIYLDAVCMVVGNVIKCTHSPTESTMYAPIYMASNGRKSIVVANIMQGSRITRALVEVSGTSGRNFKAIIALNGLGTGSITCSATTADVWTSSSGAMVADDKVFFETVTDTNATANTTYYVSDVSGSTFKLRTAAGGGGSYVDVTSTISSRTVYLGSITAGVVSSGGADVAENYTTRTLQVPPFTTDTADAVIGPNIIYSSGW